MKNILLTVIFLLSSLITLPANAQVCFSHSGALLADGAVVSATNVETSPLGMSYIASGLSLVGDASQEVSCRLSIEIESISGGVFQICWPSKCVQKKDVSVFSTEKAVVAPASSTDIVCEFVVQENASCRVKLCIETESADGTWVASHSVIVSFGNTTSALHQTNSTTKSGVEYYDLQGRRLQPSDTRRGFYIRRQSGTQKVVVR